MGSYILVIILLANSQSADVRFQEFNNLESCKSVAATIKDNAGRSMAFCVKK